MEISTFSDFEAYAAAIQDADTRVMLPRLDQPLWQISRFMVNGIGIQQGLEGSGTIVEGAVRPGGCVIFVPMANASRYYKVNGHDLDECALTILGPGAEFCITASQASEWCSIFIPFNLATAWASDLGSHPFPLLPPVVRVMRTSQEGLVRLRAFVQRFTAAVDHHSGLLTLSAPVAGAVSELKEVIAQALNPGGRTSLLVRGRPSISRERLIGKVKDCLQEHADGQVSLEDLATAAGVSERTIRTAFHDYYGIGPCRYLHLRQLHLIRRTLKGTDPGMATVSAVATHFGVWELGRFAQRYRTLFGELPSATLNRGRLVGACR